jgi:ppGpp synthetase/RelA/SpoT-type nucleotidyltranferase
VALRRDRLDLPEYRSLREIKCEIQVRTVLQDAWAEVEHFLAY